MSAGSPSAAQCLWLTSRLYPIRKLFDQFKHCTTAEDLRIGLSCVQNEIDAISVQFATLVWATSRKCPELAPSTGSLDSKPQRKSIAPEMDVVYGDTDSIFVKVPSPKTSKPVSVPERAKTNQRTPDSSRKSRRPTKKIKPSPISLSTMSKSEYKRRFGNKPVKSKKTKKAAPERVSTHKELLWYLLDNHFVKTNESRSSDTRYSRNYCGCGQCENVFAPEPACPDVRCQFTDVTHSSSKTKTKYYRNKRSDVEKLTAHAMATYAAGN